MENFIIISILVVLVILIAVYIYKSKKRGKKCIGCPYNCSCLEESKKSCAYERGN